MTASPADRARRSPGTPQAGRVKDVVVVGGGHNGLACDADTTLQLRAPATMMTHAARPQTV